ncbi:MAG TPA: nucleoside triphosphate pyrophosphohydrolase family protein [Candidatus Saccharimonadales bacterium]|nr:nucleoside triphosphate pyrophosphohydrolase family protein [Candidatus Saccharimonadales bacterium]
MSMTFDEYQKQALTTAIPHADPLMDKTIWAMGVAGEAGEVIEKWKKIVAYKDGVVSDDDRRELGKELADVVWYIAVMAKSLDLSLDDLMQQNVEKLQSRKSRGTIKGAGDNR